MSRVGVPPFPVGSLLQVAAPTYTSTSALNAALSAAASTGSTVQVGDCTLDSLTVGVTVPDGATFICRGALTFPSNFSGVGVLFDGQHGRGEHVVKVKKAVGWDTGADTTSVGVRLRNCSGCRVSVQTSVGFWTGLDLQGDGAPPAGNQDNTIIIGDIRNNKLNLTASTLNGGYSNNHEFSGGQLRHDGGFASYVGTREVYFPDSNGNTFLGVDLEANSVERTLDLGAPMNCFVGCRWESAAGAWLAAGATDTQFIGGYNLKEMPIHDSTGGRFMVIAEGVMSPGNNSTALGWSVGYRPGGGVPYVQFDPITGEYQFIAASDSFAGLHGSTMKTTGGIGVFGHAVPTQPAAPVTLADVIAIIRSYGFSA